MSELQIATNAIPNDTAGGVIEDLCYRFLKAGRKLAEYGKVLGIRITPTLNPELLLFRQLPFEAQVSAVEKIELNVEIFGSVVMAGESLRNPHTVAWFACQKFGYVPPSDFFNKLTGDDVIQIYSIEGLHRFANLRFFEICSYTLEQLYSQPWHLLWKRDDVETQYLLSLMVKITDPAQRGTLDCLSKPHRVVETASPFKYETNYSIRHVAPLVSTDSKAKVGFIISEGVVFLGPTLTPVEEERYLAKFFESQA